MSYKILVVEDDASMLKVIQFALANEGYEVVTARDGQEGLQLFFAQNPDLLILDVTMPRLDGYEVCRRVREMANTPVIMLTALGREEDVIKGLDHGADDYLVKPFKTGELLARVRATLRRANTATGSSHKPTTYKDHHLVIDLEARRIIVANEPVKLTPTEYKLLDLLVQNKGRVIQFRQILESVWGFEYIDDIDYLRVYIWHLRRKIEPDPKNPVYLVNEQNVGYRFESQI